MSLSTLPREARQMFWIIAVIAVAVFLLMPDGVTPTLCRIVVNSSFWSGLVAVSLGWATVVGHDLPLGWRLGCGLGAFLALYVAAIPWIMARRDASSRHP